jgi:hypothetical protein
MGRRFLWVLILSAWLVPFTPHVVSVSALQSVPYDPNSILDLMPALRTAPAPGWLRQGLHLTYYAAAASVLGGRHRYVPDPCCAPRPGRHSSASIWGSTGRATFKRKCIDYSYDRASGILVGVAQANTLLRTQLRMQLTRLQ